MEIVKLKLSALEPNTGQVPGLPMNPRQWTASDVEKIAASLTETPELFEARPLLVYPHEGKFVILGGNLRHEGAKRNKATEAPCIVFPEDTPLEKLKEIVVKDNGSFGAWDYDALANEWGDLPLTEWGVPAWDENQEDEIPTDLDAEPKDAPFICKITFPDADTMTKFVMTYKDIIEEEYPGVVISESGGEL